jgi:hypothetical protein
MSKKCGICRGPMDAGRCHDCGSTAAEIAHRHGDDRELEHARRANRDGRGGGMSSKGDRAFGCITSRKPNV